MTVHGTVTFSAPFPDLEFESFELLIPNPTTPKARLHASKASNVNLIVDVASANSKQEAFDHASILAKKLSRLMSFKLGQFIGDFTVSDHSLVCDSADSPPVNDVGSSIGFFLCCDATKKLGEDAVCDLKLFLELPKHSGATFHELFRSALGMTDPLSQFMGLYSLLLALCRDSQERVDQFVLTVQPGIPTNTPFKSRKSGVQETVYTKLRNEIGHVRAGTTLDGTRNEMKTQIPGLIDVVRQLVSKQP